LTTMSVITRAVKSSLDASADALKAAEKALAAAKIANIHARAAYDAFCVSECVSQFNIEKKKEEKCKNCKCKQSSCLHGKPLTETLINNQVGLRVMSNGDSWKEEQKRVIGTIQSVKKAINNSFLMVLWDAQKNLEQFTYLSKGSSKFIVFCKTEKPKNPPFDVAPVKKVSPLPSSGSGQLNDDQSKQCSNCKRKKCVNGKFLTTFNSNNLGISVKHVEFHRDKVGKIINFDDGFVGIQWHGTNKVKRYTFLKTDDDDKAGFMFRFHCKKDADSTDEIKVAENKPVDESTDEFFDAVEDEDTNLSVEEEDPEFVILSSPSAEIVDVEKDDGQDQEKKIVETTTGTVLDKVTCSYCHSFPCNNGKFISFHKETLLGCVVEYFGSIGTIVAHRKGSFFIRWMGSENCIMWPMFKLLPETGKVNLQFKFYCNKKMIEMNGLFDNAAALEIHEEEELIEASEEAQDKCSNCISCPCRDGQYLIDFSEVRVDLRVKYVGHHSNRIDQSNKSGYISKVQKTSFYVETFGKKKPQFLIDSIGDGVGELQFLYSSQQDEDDEFNGPRQIWHKYTHFYGFNSVLDSRSMY